MQIHFWGFQNLFRVNKWVITGDTNNWWKPTSSDLNQLNIHQKQSNKQQSSSWGEIQLPVLSFFKGKKNT